MTGDSGLERRELRPVTVEQVELVLRRTDRALDPSQRIAGDELVEPFERDEDLFPGRRKTLAQRSRLGGHVVRPSDHDELGVLGRQRRETRERGDHAGAHELE